MSNIAPEWERYHEECLVCPAGGRLQAQARSDGLHRLLHAATGRTFMAQGIDRTAGRVRASMASISTARPSRGVAQTGCTAAATASPTAAVGTTYPFFATRAMMQRIYTIVKHAQPAGPGERPPIDVHDHPDAGLCHQLLGRRAVAGPERGGPRPWKCCRWTPSARSSWATTGACRRSCSGTAADRSAAWRRCRWACCTTSRSRPGSMADVEVAGRLWKTRDAFGCQDATWIPYWASSPSRPRPCRPA